jgi:phosphate acetyltransferase
VTDGKTDELLEDIVSLVMSASKGTDVLVVEGMHADLDGRFLICHHFPNGYFWYL